MGLFRFVTPDAYVSAVSDIDPQPLYEQGYRGVIVDLDNTIIEWHVDDEPSQKVLAWFMALKDAGFETCLVSNNFSDRVTTFAEILDIPAISNARKPRRSGFLKAMDLMETPPSKTIMVGDQLFTDVLGANRLGIYTILVVPMTDREFVGTRIVRRVERWVLKRLVRKGRLEYPEERYGKRDEL